MSTPSHPSVVFIVGDNVGWGDIGCYGGLADKRLDCGWVLRPVVERLGALAQSATRYPHIKPGEEFTGYS